MANAFGFSGRGRVIYGIEIEKDQGPLAALLSIPCDGRLDGEQVLSLRLVRCDTPTGRQLQHDRMLTFAQAC